MIGRQAERAEIEQAIGAVAKGQGRVVLVAGEAGVGKTTLVEEVVSRSGATVLRARAVDGMMPAYGLISGVLRDGMRRRQLLPPELEHPPNVLGGLLAGAEAPAQPFDFQALLDSVSRTLERSLAGETAILFLDDLHWSDQASLELLPLLADNFQHQPVMILGVYRNEGLARDHRLRWVRTELRRRKLLAEVVLGALEPHETAAMVEAMLGQPVSSSLCELVHARSQGVPLFVEEFCLALKGQGRLIPGEQGLELAITEPLPVPEGIRDMVLLRVDGLSESERGQLEVAAVSGVEFELDLVAKLTGDEAGLDTLFQHHLIVPAGEGRAAFRNELIRAAVLSEIPWSRQRQLNRRVAAYLEAIPSPPERIARHWLAADERLKARHALLAAAEFSCGLHAYRDAAQAAERALQLWPADDEPEARLQVLEQFAHCAEMSGQLDLAVKSLREAEAHPTVESNPHRRAEVCRSLATVYGLLSAWKPYLETRRRSAEYFLAAGMTAEAATEYLAAAARCTGLYELPQALELCSRAVELAGAAGRVDLKARAMGLQGNVLAMSGRHQEGIELSHQALNLALKENAIAAAAEVYRRLGTTLEYASEYAASKEHYLRAHEFCRSSGDSFQAQLCLSCMAWVLFRTGDWKRCLEVCREVLRDAGSPPVSKAVAGSVLGLIRLYRGETQQARNLLETAHRVARREDSPLNEMIAGWGLALLEEFYGHSEHAAGRYLRILEIREAIGDTHDCLTPLFSGVAYFAGRGSEQEAAMCVSAVSAIASSTGNPEAHSILAFSLGELAWMQGNWDEAVRCLSQALAQLEKLGVPLDHLWVQHRLGSALVKSGERLDGIRHLRSSYRHARKLGARLPAARIAATLAELGEPVEEPRSPQAQARSLHAGLTLRQLEIARLIAEGLTNKEIAEKLFISPRTVEMHVANLLNRLDCRNRSEAVHRAARLGLLELRRS